MGTCPYCLEVTRDGAVRCPHCTSWLVAEVPEAAITLPADRERRPDAPAPAEPESEMPAGTGTAHTVVESVFQAAPEPQVSGRPVVKTRAIRRAAARPDVQAEGSSRSVGKIGVGGPPVSPSGEVSRTEALRRACLALVEGTRNRVEIGAFGIPLEFSGEGQSLQSCWDGLRYRVRQGFRSAGRSFLDDPVAAAVAAIYLTTTRRSFEEIEGVAYLTLDPGSAEEARRLFRDRDALAARLREHIPATATGRRTSP